MKSGKSLPIDDEAFLSFSLEIESQTIHLKVKHKDESLYNEARFLMKQGYENYKLRNSNQLNAGQRPYTAFDSLMMLAFDAFVDTLKMKHEYLRSTDQIAQELNQVAEKFEKL